MTFAGLDLNGKVGLSIRLAPPVGGAIEHLSSIYLGGKLLMDTIDGHY
jgi:hypothetical protein